MKKVLSAFLLFAVVNLYLPVLAVSVPANTSIFITPKETVTSKDNNVNIINATITSDVVINNKVVFKAGDRAVLNICDIEKARCWGKAGKFTVNNGYAYDAKGNKRKILFSKNYYGEEKTWPKACGAVSIFFLFPLALFGFVHGGQAKISASCEIEANLASSFAF